MSDAPPLDVLVPGFRLSSIIGSGSFGTVYLATQEDLGREVAIKVLNAVLGDVSARRRFQREAQALAKMHHPNLVQVYAYHDDDAWAWLAMEWIDGGTLRDRLRNPGCPRQLSLPDVRRLAGDLFSALAALHGAQLVHRDVKPANILYRSSGEALLGDLGLVLDWRQDVTRLTRDGGMMGTLPYIAPEAYCEGGMTTGTDLYAAGITIYEALTGKHPTNHGPIPGSFRPADPRLSRPDTPAELGDLVMELLEPEPRRRPGSAREVLRRLQAGRSTGRRIPVTPASPPSPSPSASRSLVGRLAAVALVGVVAWLGLGLRERLAPRNVTLDIHATCRGGLVRAPLAAPGLILCVFNAPGPLVGCFEGRSTGTDTIFELAGLAPGTVYRVQLMAGSSSSKLIGEGGFATPAEVIILGVDQTVPPRLWLKVTPPAQARLEGQSHATQIGPGGGNVPWTPGPDPAAPPMLEFTFDDGNRARLRLTLPPHAAASLDSRSLPLGIMVKSLQSRLIDSEGPLTAEAWLKKVRPQWVALSVGRDGEPASPSVAAELSRAGLRTAFLVHPSASPESAPERRWFSEIETSAPRSIVVIDPKWLHSNFDGDQGPAALERVARWRDWITAEHPDLEFIVPAPLAGYLLGIGIEPLAGPWGKTLGALNDVEWVRQAENLEWLDVWKTIKRKFDTAGAPTMKLRSAWIPPSNEVSRLLSPVDPFNFARIAMVARASLPDAITVFALEDLLDSHASNTGKAPKLTKVWDELERTARTLSGVRFDRFLPLRGAELPRLTGPPGAAGISFSGGGRRVHVLFGSGRSLKAQFWPARPGRLSIPHPHLQQTPAERTVDSTAPLDIDLQAGPAFFEEFTPLQIHVMAGSVPVTIIPPP